MKNYFNLFGCCDKLFIILIIFIVIDYITGILKAIYNKELNSRIEIYWKYVQQGIETDVEWVDNVADRETVKVLQELLKESEE